MELGRENDPDKRMDLIRSMARNVRTDTPRTLDWAMGLENPDERRAALDAINEILEDTTTPMLKMVLRFIKIDIESGQTFAESLARHPKVFPPLILNLARIGEETGNLDEMLMRASTHLRHIQEIISSTRRSLMYPSFLLFMVFGSAVFWFYYVVPKLVELFKDMGVELPFLTRALIYVADWVQSYLGITLMSIAVAVALIIIIRIFLK
jgi:general secretion pathway protein F/type IV pilus assembly protein PilC